MNMLINFDYNASAPLLDVVVSAVQDILSSLNGNASSTHTLGRCVRKIKENARDMIAQLIGCASESIVFTSGATEANNTVLQSFSGDVFISAIEHPSVLKSRQDVTVINVDGNGIVDMNHLKDLLLRSDKPKLVSVMMANNETGVIQPVAEIAKLCAEHGAFFHSDVVQAVGRIPVDFSLFDCATLSGHKIGALQGVGCIIRKENFPLKPVIIGGGQERFYRAGTENILAIHTLAIALQHVMQSSYQKKWSIVKEFRKKIESEIVKASSIHYIIAKDVDRLPNTVAIAMPCVKSETQIIRFDLANVMVSAGSACSSGKVRQSHVLQAMSVDDQIISSTIRVSLSPDTIPEDVTRFVALWKNMYTSDKNKER